MTDDSTDVVSELRRLLERGKEATWKDPVQYEFHCEAVRHLPALLDVVGGSEAVRWNVGVG